MKCCDVCDGYPERCPGCHNAQEPHTGVTVNNYQVNISGGLLAHIAIACSAIVILSHDGFYGSGKVYNPAGIVRTDPDPIHYLTQVGEEARYTA